jgi:MFS family permease
MLLAVAFGAGTVLGPLLSGLAFENLGWTGCTAMLGLLSVSAIVPVVSACVFIQYLLNIVANFK